MYKHPSETPNIRRKNVSGTFPSDSTPFPANKQNLEALDGDFLGSYSRIYPPEPVFRRG
jgi:hypothetical protein